VIRFVDAKRASAIHDLQIGEHGGSPGIRDIGLLESGLNRPVNIAAYEAAEDLSRLGAAYLHGIAKNHPFIDGNKRTALAVLGLFLAMNGYEIVATDEALYKAVLGAAEGSLGEQDFAGWLRQNIARRQGAV
jgi:death-on-curing protein